MRWNELSWTAVTVSLQTTTKDLHLPEILKLAGLFLFFIFLHAKKLSVLFLYYVLTEFRLIAFCVYDLVNQYRFIHWFRLHKHVNLDKSIWQCCKCKCKQDVHAFRGKYKWWVLKKTKAFLFSQNIYANIFLILLKGKKQTLYIHLCTITF